MSFIRGCFFNDAAVMQGDFQRGRIAVLNGQHQFVDIQFSCFLNKHAQQFSAISFISLGRSDDVPCNSDWNRRFVGRIVSDQPITHREVICI